MAGTYLHGVFDSPEALQQIIRWAGLETTLIDNYEMQQEREIERLAVMCNNHLNWRKLDPLFR